jgi:GT2 family glycosyltransferase
MKSIDIVIVNHNSTDDAAKAIESIIGATDGVVPNIVVADNASSDQPERLAQRFPQIRLLLSKRIWAIPKRSTGHFRNAMQITLSS